MSETPFTDALDAYLSARTQYQIAVRNSSVVAQGGLVILRDGPVLKQAPHSYQDEEQEAERDLARARDELERLYSLVVR